MGFQIASLSQIIVPTGLTPTSAASGFPASRLTETQPPYVRPWRSTSTVEQTLSFTMASTAIVGCHIYDANFTSVTVASVGRTIQKDPWDSVRTPRYKLWVPLALAAQTAQTVVIPNQATTDGAAYFQCGKIQFVKALTELGQDPRPDMPVSIVSPQLIAQSSNDAVYESTPAGPAFIREEWEVFGSHASVADMFTVAEIGMHEPFLLYHNLGNDYETYYVQRVAEASVVRGHSAKTFSVTLRQIP